MKKILILSVFTLIFLFGCGNDNNQVKNSDNENNIPSANVESNTEVGDNEMNENADLTLQTTKIDEEAGLTTDNNDFYLAIQEVIDQDPKMGDPNDLSLFPYSVLEREDGSSVVLFLMINRLGKAMENLIFDLTLGTNDGEYVFDDMEVDLSNDVIGTFDNDSMMPIMVDIADEDIPLFESLDSDNVYLKLENVGIDFDE